MIGSLQGKIVKIDDSKVLIQTTSGIGYEVFFREKKRLKENEDSFLFITSIYKENSVELYGHQHLYEKKLFELLLHVRGVGPKTAYLLLINLGVNVLCSSILDEKTAVLKKVPGIGNKAAMQIVLDLKKKIFEFMKTEGIREKENKTIDFYDEALGALKALGFSENDMMPFISKISESEDFQSSDELVKKILREYKNFM